MYKNKMVLFILSVILILPNLVIAEGPIILSESESGEAIITGTITDKDGNLLANYPLHVFSSEHGSYGRMTDANGNFTVTVSSGFTYTVKSNKGFYYDSVVVSTVDGETTTADLSLVQHGGQISGYVLNDNGSADPVTHQRVVLVNSNGNWIAQTRTDSNGYYNAVVPADTLATVQVHIGSDSYDGVSPVQVAEGTVFNHDDFLVTTTRIIGYVYDDEGNPLSGVEVEAFKTNGNYTTTTNQEGKYVFHIRYGSSYSIVARDGKSEATGYASDMVRGEDRVVDLYFPMDNSEMNLRATGEDSKVTLNWSQNKYTSFVGYNLYRSESINGEYTLINETVISNNQNTFEDTDVTPGNTYFYMMKVVRENHSESAPSNKTSATPYVYNELNISHEPLTIANVGVPATLHASVNETVEYMTFNYKLDGQQDYTSLNMTNEGSNSYQITLEETIIQEPGFSYYLEATDGISTAKHARAEAPHHVTVQDKPILLSIDVAEGNANGGTSVTITGANFQDGISVQFGNVVAEQVTINSSNELTVVTPSHYPSMTDLTVTNPNGRSAKLYKAFNFISEGVAISIPNQKGYPGDYIDVPVMIEDVTGLRSGDLTIAYEGEQLELVEVELGNLTKNFSLATNKMQGEVGLSLASSTEVSGTGALVNLTFKVLDSTFDSSMISLSSIILNSDSIQTVSSNGTFTIGDRFSISGNVTYYSNNVAVTGVDLYLDGERAYKAFAGSDGAYQFAEIYEGSYSMSAMKVDQVTDITEYDASLILQASVGLLQLDENEFIAADVDNNGQVNALDAAYLLEYVVGLRSLPFPGSSEVWSFIQTIEPNLQPIEQSHENVDFIAILKGDVNGDWGNSSTTNMSEAYAVETQAQDENMITTITYDVGQAELYSTNVTFEYDPTLYEPVSYEKGDSIKNNSIAVNTSEQGKLVIAIAGSQAITDSGDLVKITFKKLNTANVSSAEGNAGVDTASASSDSSTKPFAISKAEINEDELIVRRVITSATKATVGKQLEWKADILGEGLLYAWVVYKNGKEIMKTAYSTDKSLNWKPTNPGIYKVELLVTDANRNVLSTQTNEIRVTGKR